MQNITAVLTHSSGVVVGTTGWYAALDAMKTLTRKAATVTGTTATDLLKQANTALQTAGKPTVNIVMFPDNAPALQQVQFGQVAAYGVAYETALYYAALQPNQFEVGGAPYFKILTGIGVSKDQPGLKAELTTALHGMMEDGSYANIFEKWHIGVDVLQR